jgi:Calcineurin-like phosphoesterase
VGLLVAVAISSAVLAASSTLSRHPAFAAPDRPCAVPDLVLPMPSSFTFAVIGDYGDFPSTGRVASTMAGWNPSFIVTVGDNGYNPDATSNGAGGFVWNGSLIDRSIGQWFSSYIGNYQGAYGGGPAPGRPSRFFPALGNHDWDGSPGGGVWANLPYRSYFTLPGNERYYTVRAGSVQFFVIDSEPRSPGNGSQYETDGVSASSTQALWLRDHLADSDAPFKIVVFHHPAYTSAPRGNTTVMQWPFAEWGASLVLSGHEHIYERLTGPGGIPFVTAGHGGNTLTNVFPNSPFPAVSLVRVGDPRTRAHRSRRSTRRRCRSRRRCRGARRVRRCRPRRCQEEAAARWSPRRPRVRIGSASCPDGASARSAATQTAVAQNVSPCGNDASSDGRASPP